MYLYRCYVAQRNYGLVLAETEGEKAQDPSIGAVRTLASFKKAGGDAALEKDAVDEVQRWIDAGTATANATQQVIAATVLMTRGRIDDAMKVLHNSLSLEAFVPFCIRGSVCSISLVSHTHTCTQTEWHLWCSAT